MSKVDDLDAQIAELQAKKAEAIKNEKKSQLSSIKSLLRKYKVTFAEIEKSLSPGKGYRALKIYPDSGYFDFENIRTEDDIIDEDDEQVGASQAALEDPNSDCQEVWYYVVGLSELSSSLDIRLHPSQCVLIPAI